MADAVRVTALNLREIRSDLDAISRSLGREITLALKSASDTVARATPTRTPVGPGPRGARDNLPHIASTIGARMISGTTAAVTSTHPGAVVHEWGGTIAPRGGDITIRRSAMAHQAADATLSIIEQDLKQRVERLIREHGLHH